jgi:23S rRNA pseudouridine1911/1915/1917 synthase
MNLVANEQMRIDKYLGANTDISRSTIDKMLKSNYVLVNDLPVKPSYKLKLGDNIQIKDGFSEEIKVEPQKMDLDIVYEDNDLLIINKPSGLAVHPGAGNYNNTLVNGLMFYTKNLSNCGEEFRPGIVHRIDKDTSGLLVVAKNNKMHEALALMFKEHTIKREYIALLNGVLPYNTLTIDAPIGRDPKNRQQMTVTDVNSKKAITHLTVLKRYQNYTLVKLRLETGRTHQIRVHMKYIGYPVYNDPVYSNKSTSDFGQFLHSYSIDFIKPFTDERITLSAPIPKYFQEFIDNLK